MTLPSFGLQLVWTLIFSQGNPLVGWFSDTSSRSRRKPLLVIGAAGIVFFLSVLAWVPSIASALKGAFSMGEEAQKLTKIFLAILSILGLNLFIQPYQIASRCMLYDTCPPTQQLQASAWNSMAISLGNILGYLMGVVDLPMPTTLPTLTKLQRTTLLIAASLLICTMLAYMFTTEARNDTYHLESVISNSCSPRHILQNITQTGWLVSRVTSRILETQFLHWMGWFTVIYYHTRRVANVWCLTSYIAGLHAKHSTVASPDSDDANIQAGSLSGLYFAIVSFSVNSLCVTIFNQISLTNGASSRRRTEPCFALNLSIYDLWIFGQLLFFLAATVGTCFVDTVSGGTFLMSILGVPGALNSWIPYGIVGSEITERDLPAGMMSSLQNAAISAPQILSAAVCAVILEVVRVLGGTGDVVWTMRFGGCVALLAIYPINCLRLNA
ncbi:uncharacterized protein BCR38DRAFT_412319 [Pseudomassariella vexata]|uniref:Major facilitator superfamily domain-containing protein n=1 Tax=Pseudomassariella vexata TaxID=1141098 RepID=A0A1Y2DLV7_9PEZI|nr:uncharacterized protein BCR38DRAFT_412319 [Pseudomassariella vexata]ORY60119.1 hypothetical protein BCR38DRAFT_412319 [Pseudomassariella vexata]